jgi:hypothetical protein
LPKRKKLGSQKDLNKAVDGLLPLFPVIDEESKQVPKWLEDIVAIAAKNPELVGLAGSIGAIALGASLIMDDYKDLGEPICPGCKVIPNAPHPHHWLLGCLILLSGVAGTCASGLTLLKKLGPPPKPEEKLPPSVLEGAPREIVESFR